MDAFTLAARLTLNREEFDSGMRQVEGDLEHGDKSAFSAWGVAVGQLAARAFTRVFRAGVDFAKSIISTGMEFDAMMSEVQAVANLTEEQFQEVRQRALDLGESTKFTATEVGEAFYYMGLAGWKSGEMLKGIDGVLDLAAASGESLGRVSDIVTDAITAMGLTADDTANFVNVLAAASTNSNTTVSMMGEAFKYLATTGGILGYTIEDVATVLGLLANNGIKATQAGTSMRQILNTLVAPSDKAAEAMKALGISLFDPETDARKPLMQVVEEIREIFKEANFNLEGFDAEEFERYRTELDAWYDEELRKISDADYNAKVTKQLMKALDDEYTEKFFKSTQPNEWFLSKVSGIGGLRGISSLFALMKSTDEDVEQLVSAVSTSSEGQGAAATMAEIMIDNLRGDITLLNSAMDGLKILISDDFKGQIREFIQMLTAQIRLLSEAFDEGGLSGMFINLTDWIINGITDTLSNPEITVDGANRFGEALGNFVGHLVTTLLSNAPQLLGGLFEAGMSLAKGLLNGLFAGLFGTGDGTVYGLLDGLEEEKNDLIADANATAEQASGIVGYMETLIDKYGEAAKDSNEWADAMGRLNELIPGITDAIKLEGQELGTTTASFKEYIAQHKAKAIEDAKNAYLGDIRSAYEANQIAIGKAQINAEIAQYEQEAAARAIAEYYLANRAGAMNAGIFGAEGYEADAFSALNTVEELIEFLNSTTYGADDLAETAQEYGDALAKATGDTNYMKGEEAKIIEQLSRAYTSAQKSYYDNAAQVDTLTQAASELQTTLLVAESAVARLAERADGADIDGSHASGLAYAPYDGYIAELHRGEQVLTSTDARRNRQSNSGGFDITVLTNAVSDAIRQAMANTPVNAFLDGKRVTDEISRNLNEQLALAR